MNTAIKLGKIGTITAIGGGIHMVRAASRGSLAVFFAWSHGIFLSDNNKG